MGSHYQKFSGFRFMGKKNVDAPSDWEIGLFCCWEYCLPRIQLSSFPGTTLDQSKMPCPRSLPLPGGTVANDLSIQEAGLWYLLLQPGTLKGYSLLSSPWAWLRPCFNCITICPLANAAFLLPSQAWLWRTLSMQISSSESISWGTRPEIKTKFKRISNEGEEAKISCGCSR